MWPGEVFYLPDPCELTFANTLLLSNAAISLGNAFINLGEQLSAIDCQGTNLPRSIQSSMDISLAVNQS